MERCRKKSTVEIQAREGQQILRSLPYDDRHLVVGSTLVCCLVKDHECA
jgi:hypothetical protein